MSETSTASAATEATAAAEPAKPKLSAQELLVRLRNDVRELKGSQRVTNEVGDYLVKRNEVLENALFVVIGTLNDQAAVGLSNPDPEVQAAANARIQLLLQLQSAVSPKAFETAYGVDHITGADLDA